MIDAMAEPALAALGMRVPDSALARQARELITTVAPAYLVNHSIRAFAWAVELARIDGLRFDSEILYVSAALHDIGLVPAYDLGGCFERDGAIAAQRFAMKHGQLPERGHAIFQVIDLHMAAELPADATNEDILLEASTGTDVTGYRYAEIPAPTAAAILAAYPRLDFKVAFAAAFRDQAARKPGCRVGEMVRTGKLEAIEKAPFGS